MEYAPCHNVEDVPAPTGYWRTATDYMIKRIQDKSVVIFMPIVGIPGASRKYYRNRSQDGVRRAEEGFYYFKHCKDEDDIIVQAAAHKGHQVWR